MKKIILLILTVIFLSPITKAQEAKVENVDLKVKNNKVFINYDLISNDLSKENSVELFFIDDRFTIKVPGKVSGDIGEGIEPGVNKTIEWDVFKDNIAIAQKLQPKIIVNGIKKGGAKNAYLSMLIPGLGDYFVKDHRDMILKPYIRTATVLGLVASSIVANYNREKVDTYGWSQSYRGWNTSNDPIWAVIGYDYNYWLFENDAEILLAAGISLWVADIIWVYAKGLENEKFKMFSNYSFDVKSHNGFTGFSLSYKF
ncbi:MAG: hypothetical protein R6U15_03780 [Candidatus Izemoplasmatales bacterium]